MEDRSKIHGRQMEMKIVSSKVQKFIEKLKILVLHLTSNFVLLQSITLFGMYLGY